MARVETIKVVCSKDKQENVIREVGDKIKTISPGGLFDKPIIGQREGDGDRVTLIYEGVLNFMEVSLIAMCSGASFVEEI